MVRKRAGTLADVRMLHGGIISYHDFITQSDASYSFAEKRSMASQVAVSGGLGLQKYRETYTCTWPGTILGKKSYWSF